MHAGVSSAQHVDEGDSDDHSGSDKPLIRELDLDGIAAQAPDELLESTTEHTDQDSTTSSCDHVLAPRRARVYIIHRYSHNCMTF